MKKMSFDLYLYINGVDKNKHSRQTICIFQQYINYQKDMDLREFANSSSIFQIYIDQNRNDFDALKNNIKTKAKIRKD